MYDKRPTRWRDVPRQRDDVFLPVVSAWEGGEVATAIEAGYRALPATWDEGTEDKIARMLLDVFRHKKGAGAEMEPLKPTVGEILASAQDPHLSAPRPQSRLPGLRVRRHHRGRATGCPSWRPSCGRPWCSTTSTGGIAPRSAPSRWASSTTTTSWWCITRGATTSSSSSGASGAAAAPRPARPAPRPAQRARHPLSPDRRPAAASPSCRAWRRWPAAGASTSAPTTTSSGTRPIAGRP